MPTEVRKSLKVCRGTQVEVPWTVLCSVELSGHEWDLCEVAVCLGGRLTVMDLDSNRSSRKMIERGNQ